MESELDIGLNTLKIKANNLNDLYKVINDGYGKENLIKLSVLEGNGFISEYQELSRFYGENSKFIYLSGEISKGIVKEIKLIIFEKNKLKFMEEAKNAIRH